ncbi:MAG: hypothetical protein NTX95_11925 [Actinobacteria bacterium]|nr:hypothetical protein [Actinomycetota bacterium]
MRTAARDTALHALVPVERLLRRAEPDAVPDLLELRAALESTAGRTVTRGRAARFLALTQTSIDRWIADGAIPTVIDIDGKTMVPTRELIRLRVEMDDVRRHGAQRPLSVVVRQRRDRATHVPFTEIAPPDLLAELTSPGHRRAEVVDLAVHRLLTRDLDERAVAIARWQLEAAAHDGVLHAVWAERWRALLERAPAELRTLIAADTPEAARLRQTSPFKGLVPHEDRRALMQYLVEAA